MEPGSLMPHLQRLFNNPYPELKTQFLILIYISLRYILIFFSHLCIGLPRCLFPVGLPVNILKELPYPILATLPAYLNF